ncbi:MAG: high-potential iron-sulfur protein [Steroidobacteraceae bacterium]
MSEEYRPNPSRRRFVLLSLTGAGTAALWTLGAGSRHSGAQAAAVQRVSPNEPLAKALGYTENARTVDKAKFPTYMPGQGCDTCRFFQGKAGQAWGPCQIFMGKDVSIKGWCASYAKKT